MKHKYKIFHFVNGKTVCEWEEEEIEPILYLNDYYNFLDTENFENAYGHGKGSKNYIYEVLKKHLQALEIIKNKYVDVYSLIQSKTLGQYNNFYIGLSVQLLEQEEYDLLKEVLK